MQLLLSVALTVFRLVLCRLWSAMDATSVHKSVPASQIFHLFLRKRLQMPKTRGAKIAWFDRFCTNDIRLFSGFHVGVTVGATGVG
jgi:hypothetical protein